METTTVSNAVDTVTASVSHAQTWSLTGWDSIFAGDGLIISFVGIIVVFLSLTLLSLLIRGMGKYVRYEKHKKKRTEAAQAEGEVQVARGPNGFSGELVAAISLALNEYLYEQHDEEKTIITIQKISKPYSPWSSKLYNMTRPPHHSIKRG